MKSVIFVFLFLQMGTLCQSQVEVKIHSKEGYEGYEAFAERAADSLETVLNSTKFRDAIRDGVFTHRNGKANLEIFETIMQAHEVDGPGGKDSVVDLRLRTITRAKDGKKWSKRRCSRKTVGRDGGSSGVTATCPQKMALWKKNDEVGRLAGHYMHEYMHVLGFNHKKGDKYESAVYKIGYIVRDIISGEL